MIRAGHCCDCGIPTWRTIPHPKTGDPFLLWPMPTSVYLRVQCGPDRLAPGIGCCPDCAPAVGAPAPACIREHLPEATTVEAIETAGDRYRTWYQPAFRAWLAVHLVDEFRTDPAEVLAQWDQDVAAVVP